MNEGARKTTSSARRNFSTRLVRRIYPQEEISHTVVGTISIVLMFMVLGATNVAQSAHEENFPKSGMEWRRTLSNTDGPLEQLRLVIPFYEGLEITNPTSSLREAGITQFELAYPGALSAPFVAWTFGADHWTAVYVQRLDTLPVALDLNVTTGSIDIALRSYTASTYRVLKVDGDWTQVAKALRNAWDVNVGAAATRNAVQ